MEQNIQNLSVADSLHIRGIDSIPSQDLELRNFFDLSHESVVTSCLGTLHPVSFSEVDSGVSFKIDAPVAIPVADAFTHPCTFYMRDKELWKDYPSFINCRQGCDD